MAHFAWIMARVVAAISGAFMVGLLVGVILWVRYAATCGADGSTCGDFLAGLTFSVTYIPLWAVVIGTLPGIALLTVTPARTRPWRSLLVLVPATAIGFAVWLLLRILSEDSDWAAWWIAMVLLPAIFGLAAACTIGKLPRRWGLA